MRSWSDAQQCTLHPSWYNRHINTCFSLLSLIPHFFLNSIFGGFFSFLHFQRASSSLRVYKYHKTNLKRSQIGFAKHQQRTSSSPRTRCRSRHFCVRKSIYFLRFCRRIVYYFWQLIDYTAEPSAYVRRKGITEVTIGISEWFDNLWQVETTHVHNQVRAPDKDSFS